MSALPDTVRPPASAARLKRVPALLPPLRPVSVLEVHNDAPVGCQAKECLSGAGVASLFVEVPVGDLTLVTLVCSTCSDALPSSWRRVALPGRAP